MKAKEMESITSIYVNFQFDKYPQHTRGLLFRTNSLKCVIDIFRDVENFAIAQRVLGENAIRANSYDDWNGIVVTISAGDNKNYLIERKLSMRFYSFNDSLNDYIRQIAMIFGKYEHERVISHVS